MKPDYNLCDLCGKPTKVRPVFATTDRKMDGAGSMDDVGENVDLCPEHLGAALQFMVDESYEHAKRFVEWARKHRKAVKA